ncbi:MAG: hypothetical protein Q4B50_07350 [Bacillota bacterium]|nr:hypothetical protein [Bacillota bacterium]
MDKREGFYYDLQLFDNGDCFFSIAEVNGSQLGSYEGWWTLFDSMLKLSLELISGQHPESPEKDQFIGSYLVSNWEPGALTLRQEFVCTPTLDMEESKEEDFWGF